MSTIRNKPVSEKELENLLAQAFLNLDFNNAKNSELMETISTHHLVNRPSFLYKLKNFFSSGIFAGMVLFSLVTGFILNRFPENENNIPEKNTTIPVANSENPHEDIRPLQNKKQVAGKTNSFQQKEQADTSQNIAGEQFNEIQTAVVTNEKNHPENKRVTVEAIRLKTDSNYIFPTLTEDELKDHIKQKNKMVSQLSKLNKDKYVYIPSGSFDYKKKTISVNAFYAQTTEVTNLEYRTFLTDLLLQNRKQEFLDALPDQNQWVLKMPGYNNEAMVLNYFSHPSYDDYPVVNISRRGAEMYCQWLTEEVNGILTKSNKPTINKLRIPFEYEWMYAALNGKSSSKYANGSQNLKDDKNLYEMNYNCHSLEECRYDSTLHLYLPGSDNRKYSEDGGFYTVKVTSYNPNSYGLYCMAGNVSEMIILHESKMPATKGGSWFSCDHFLETEAEDEYHGETEASPFIGFRPVFSFLITP